LSQFALEEVIMRTIMGAAILAALTTTTLSADMTPSAWRALLEQRVATTAAQPLDMEAVSSFLAHVEAGDRGWIDLVPLLAAQLDAGVSESLVTTLTEALRTNPQAVLGVMAASHYDAADVCGGRAPDASVLDTVRLIDDALVMVAAVLDPNLTDARNACLYSLTDARIAALI
jgi:hypothetical protein